jgi:hypothetical protein
VSGRQGPVGNQSDRMPGEGLPEGLVLRHGTGVRMLEEVVESVEGDDVAAKGC